MKSDEQEICQLISTWMTATKAGDTNTVLSLMAEDVVFLLPGQSPMIGKAGFAAATKAQSAPGAPHFEGTSEIQEIKVLGDWAIYVDQTYCCCYPAWRRPFYDACWAHALYP